MKSILIWQNPRAFEMRYQDMFRHDWDENSISAVQSQGYGMQRR